MSAPETERLEQIEIRIAYLEQANAQLSDMVIRQQQELETLRTRLTTQLARIEAAQAQATEYTDEEEKPPHY
jgi:SlyX protein